MPGRGQMSPGAAPQTGNLEKKNKLELMTLQKLTKCARLQIETNVLPNVK